MRPAQVLEALRRPRLHEGHLVEVAHVKTPVMVEAARRQVPVVGDPGLGEQRPARHRLAHVPEPSRVAATDGLAGGDVGIGVFSKI